MSLILFLLISSPVEEQSGCNTDYNCAHEYVGYEDREMSSLDAELEGDAQ